MRIDIDLTQVPDLKPLPTGTYVIRIVGSTLGESQTGNPKVIYEAEVLEPQHIAQEVPKWYFTLSLVDRAMFRIKELFRATNKLHGGSFDTDEVIGEQVGVVVTHELSEVTGRPQNQIVRFVPVSKAAPSVADEAVEEWRKADEMFEAV